MDLHAYALMEEVEEIKDYIKKNYGDVPRIRGVRFMKLESDWTGEDLNEERLIHDKYVGQDVIYIHTRSGSCGNWYSEDSNYIYFGADKWEESNSELFLEHVNDSLDWTYATHYFKAVVDDDYNNIINQLNKLYNSSVSENETELNEHDV